MFDAPESALGDLGTDAAAELIAAASDIALILDSEGRILDLAFGNDELSTQIGDWIGLSWSDTVTSNSRARVGQLLHSAGIETATHVIHFFTRSPKFLKATSAK